MEKKKLSVKKQCLSQDASGTIVLHLWDEFINQTKRDDTYQINNVVIRHFDESEFGITTTAETVIIPLNKTSTLRLNEKIDLHKDCF